MKNNFPIFLILIILVFGFASNIFAQVSEDVSITAIVGDVTPPTLGGGGGGAYIPPPVLPKTSVRFSGEAYPNATVKILEAGVEKAMVIADTQGNFSATFEETFDENVLYTLHATDTLGQRSLLLNYPLALKEGYLTHLSGIRFPPTVRTDKSQVKTGEFLEVSGHAFSQRLIEVYIEGGLLPSKDSGVKKKFFVDSRVDGSYKLVLPLDGLSKGDYLVYVKYPNDARVSKLVRFVIADTNIKSEDLIMNLPGDCNADSAVDLVDFSVLAYWYKRPEPPVCVDLNQDGVVSLVDFSILAFYWTG